MSNIVEKFDQTVDLLLKRRHIHRSYAAVFGAPEGELVLEHILAAGFVTKSTFVAGDSHQTAMNEGSRRLALSILKMARTNHKEMVRAIEKQLQDSGIQL